MTETHKAKLAFLTQPSQGVYMLNLQFENGANLRVELSRIQVGNAVRDGVVMLWGGERTEMAEFITVKGPITTDQRDALVKEWKTSKGGKLTP